ncbi:hypothetical protein ACF07T_40595 [Streptomyces sp. NPDC015184]|uniref:hypothetical protein n=1 Tax=Streptomyces sp. NPDC015184 TaxID=3364946 RepID=UPI0036FE855E
MVRAVPFPTEAAATSPVRGLPPLQLWDAEGRCLNREERAHGGEDGSGEAGASGRDLIEVFNRVVVDDVAVRKPDPLIASADPGVAVVRFAEHVEEVVTGGRIAEPCLMYGGRRLRCGVLPDPSGAQPAATYRGVPIQADR